jgi:hypothetical protein
MSAPTADDLDAIDLDRLAAVEGPRSERQKAVNRLVARVRAAEAAHEEYVKQAERWLDRAQAAEAEREQAWGYEMKERDRRYAAEAELAVLRPLRPALEGARDYVWAQWNNGEGDARWLKLHAHICCNILGDAP